MQNNPPSASNPKSSKLKKFLLKSWQPVPTWQSTIVLFAVLGKRSYNSQNFYNLKSLSNWIGILLMIFGIVLVSINDKIVEVPLRYDDQCALGDPCELQFNITEKMSTPFLYYELDNFYQNHRRYIKSRSSEQLAGSTIDLDSATSDCDPLITNAQMGKTKSMTNSDLDPNAIAYPCGLIAASLFTGIV